MFLNLWSKTHAYFFWPFQGINRAFPYVSSTEADDIIEVQTPMLFRLVIFLLFVILGCKQSISVVILLSTDIAILTEHVPTFILTVQVHSKNFNVGVQALMLLDKISSKNQIVSDRFYRALYSKLLLPAAMNSSKASLSCVYICSFFP